MAEEAASQARAAARIQFSDLVPTGRSMVEVELGCETVLCVRPGEMSEQLRDEWNEHLAHATQSGRWNRVDPDDDTPGGHPQD